MAISLVGHLWLDHGASASGPEFDLSSTTAGPIWHGTNVLDRTGVRMTGCDVNGDGLGDLVVGDDLADSPDGAKPNVGEVDIIFGRRKAWSGNLDIRSTADIRVLGERSTDDLGAAVACGDVNADGFDDLLLCAPYADRDRDGTWTSGQAHLILGGPSIPNYIDLALTPHTVIRGTIYAGALCRKPAIADINGDGIKDLILEDANSKERTTTKRAGRVYVLFGRSSWPAEIDFLHQSADMTIYGTAPQGFAEDLAGGDLTGDGTDDLAVCARLTDGPSNSRKDSGSVLVFHGRSNWPAFIDLLTTAPTTTVYGVDAGDQIGNNEGVRIADLVGDSRQDLILGTRLAYGRSNSAQFTGETRIITPGPSLPATIDMRTQTDHVIWGADAGDQSATAVVVGDVNADGRKDLVISGTYADGPSNARLDAGELAVVYGASFMPFEQDFGAGQYDMLIYGDRVNARLFSTAAVDLNGDGLADIAASTELDDDVQIPRVFLMSLYDTDGDGIKQLLDNCPLVYNPDQADADQDSRGDLCALDWDGDGLNDAIDCAIGNRTQGRPLEVTDLQLSHNRQLGTTTLTWPIGTTADRYDLSRGLINGFVSGDWGSCQDARDPDLSDTLFLETESPTPGNSFFYLVRAVDTGCGGSGTWGRTSSGVERVNQNPASCP